MHANLVPARTHARRSSILFGVMQEYLGCQGRQTKQISNLVCDKRFWWICFCVFNVFITFKIMKISLYLTSKEREKT